MNLLINAWIPLQQAGIQQKVTLQQLLCGEVEGELCLPRDDMEFACLQLLVAMTQVLFTPADKNEWRQRIKHPLSKEEYVDACEGKMDWFDLDHLDTPFMQFRGVHAKESTPMGKLMAGVADGTNKAFVNAQELVGGLCGGCSSIALYNTAYNCPPMGGGFQSGMRGSTPISVLIRGQTLRQTIWLNVLTVESLENELPCYQATKEQSPNYVEGIKRDERYFASNIGIVKGLFWQNARFELLPSNLEAKCSCCGHIEKLYAGFNKERFKFTIDGVWPHPLSARTFVIKKDAKEEKFPSFTTTQPTWVHLAKLVAEINKEKEGYRPAPVITQIKAFGARRLDIAVGGYRNGPVSTIVERRHEMFSLADGWQSNSGLVEELICGALEYKKALRKALYIFGKGVKDKFAGAGVNLTEQYDALFYQKTENLIHDSLAQFNFEQPEEDLYALSHALKKMVLALFEQAVAPYQQDPKMLKALASSRRLLNKYLKELEKQGGNNE